MSTSLLILTPLLPLLLAFPALRSRLPWPCYIALLPALILVTLPTPVSIELPWLLLGSGLAIDDSAERLVLAMSILFWSVVASLLPTSAAGDRLTTFFLLTLAGNLGAILATELVGFFAFSVLMGYAFYGLLVVGEDEGVRRTARLYLIVLILADLALFEALLIAAAMSGDLSFEAVRQAVAESTSPTLYLSMVFAGFAAKAAIWPLHFWLLPIFRSTRLALLLAGVPVAIALLGMVRWLPLGEITSPALGVGIQGLGVVAMLCTILAGVKRAQLKLLPAYVLIFATGLFAVAIGAGLADPAAWKQHGYLLYLFIACLGGGMAVLIAISGWWQAQSHCPVASEKQADDLSPWFERCFGVALGWGKQVGFGTLPRLRASWQAKAGRLWQVRAWQRALDGGERFLQHWVLAIILFLLLGMVVAFVSTSS